MTTTTDNSIVRALERRLGAGRVLPGDDVRYLGDETECRGLRGYRRQWWARALELHAEIKRAWDPKGLLNPGKKV